MTESPNKVWYMYVVRCSDSTFYAGATNNVPRRMHMHNEGTRGAKYTRSRRPVQLILVVVCSCKREALQMEYAFKQLTREQKEEALQYQGLFWARFPDAVPEHWLIRKQEVV